MAAPPVNGPAVTKDFGMSLEVLSLSRMGGAVPGPFRDHLPMCIHQATDIGPQASLRLIAHQPASSARPAQPAVTASPAHGPRLPSGLWCSTNCPARSGR